MKVAHISAVWPCLCCLRGRRKTSFKLALKKSLRHKMDLKMPKSELAIEEDPFLLMGKLERLRAPLYRVVSHLLPLARFTPQN